MTSPTLKDIVYLQVAVECLLNVEEDTMSIGSWHDLGK
jgi:hypothetical protein